MGECPIKSINRTALYDAARGGLESKRLCAISLAMSDRSSCFSSTYRIPPVQTMSSDDLRGLHLHDDNIEASHRS